MKQKLLILLFFSFSISFATPFQNPNPSGPSIGLIMYGYTDGFTTHFNFYIKNTGTETLTNVYVNNTPTNSSNINISTYPMGTTVIASLAPGEIDTVTFFGDKPFFCNDSPSQTIVYATTLANTQISDLSSAYSYDFDDPTYPAYDYYINGIQTGTYEDYNNNYIVDVGDVINYTYQVTGNYFGGFIYDNNAIIYNQNLQFTTGIHYITQADIDLGYVYNTTTFEAFEQCGGSFTVPFVGVNNCSCPNPDGATLVTQLTSLLPNKIKGNVKFNTANDNCTTGVPFGNRRVTTNDIANTSYSSYTNSNGDYYILIPNSGTYTTQALNNLGSGFTSNPANTVVTSSGQNQDYLNNNFCISSATGYTDLSVGMFNVSNAVPGMNAYYQLYYYNNGTTALSGSVQLTFDGTKMTFISAGNTPANTTANTITWNYTNLLPYQYVTFNLVFAIQTPPTANINDPLYFTVYGTPVSGDNHPENNTFLMSQSIRSSFDPNDKTVIEGSTIDIGHTGDYLHYVTRFQNTGTANATTVVIKENLDPNLDWNTFEPIASSHPSNIQIRNGNELTYTFSNIDLPFQSANEPASHGWMAYRIKPKSNIALWDIMSSSSNIYFDYNAPIYTNGVSTQVTALTTTDFVKSNFTVYPNPASDFITIEAKNDIDSVYEIVDINGKLLLKGTTESLHPINISNLESGFYFLNLKTNQGKATYKIVKN